MQSTQVFHAGAIIALADETATAAGWETHPAGEFRPELVPLTLHMSGNVTRKSDRGTLLAEVDSVRRGGSLAAARPAVTAPAGPRGR